MQVEVIFPTGIWTQWYPQATTVAPGIVQAGSPSRTRNGSISWDVVVRPPNMKQRHAAGDERRSAVELRPRRGLACVTTLKPESCTRSRNGNSSSSTADSAKRHCPSMRVMEQTGESRRRRPRQRAAARLHPARRERAWRVFLRPFVGPANASTQPVPSMVAARPLDAFVTQVSTDVASRLMRAGCMRRKRCAMVNTWASSYFKTDGVRLLFVMPQSWTDRYIPMRITPEPEELVRVMVGRVELLDRARELRAEKAISALASPDASVREQAFDTLRDGGRYVEPIVRRTLRTTTDEQVQTLSRRLLLTDFVTELRTALTDAQHRREGRHPPVYVQAQLASLLREVGLTRRGETGRGVGADAAVDVAAADDGRPLVAAHVPRAGASARGRGPRYRGAQVVREVRRVRQPIPAAEDVRRLPHDDGPARLVVLPRLVCGPEVRGVRGEDGQAPRLIATHETVLSATPGSRASNLSLAYLYEASGQTTRPKNSGRGFASCD